MSKEKELHDTLAQAQSTQEARMGDGVASRFNSKLRQAFGHTPFILTKFDKFMNWVRGSSIEK